MQPIIIYPLPFDAWDTFAPFVDRFTETFRRFDPGSDYEVWATCCWGRPPSMWDKFRGIRTRFFPYDHDGCDIGSAQLASWYAPNDAFMVMMTTRCHIYRHGWLKRLVEAREKHGDALYGVTASYEGGKPHICTRAYSMDAATFRQYPHVIDSREKGQKFEVGEWCLTEWFRSQNKECYLVDWETEHTQEHWRTGQNIFRRGDQSNVLVYDKHTDAYRDADAAEKNRLEAMADPQPQPSGV